MPLPVLSKDDLQLQIQQLIGSELSVVNDVLEQQFRNPNEFVRDLCDHVARYQGKRIRPVLLLLCARIFGIPPERRQSVYRLAAVVEMIHTATLVHDDVIDDADLRRHVSTVHRRWNTETSILLGDYLFSRAYHLAATTGDAEACRLIGRATDRTCEGELNQIASRLDRSVSERDYFRVIAGKTGQLFAVSCLLGARASGAPAAQQKQLRQFGFRLGLAFQIADDLIDLTERREATGKDAANDVHNGRLTLPLIRALRLATPHERQRLSELLSSDRTAAHEPLALDPCLVRGLNSAQCTADELIRRAVGNLSRLPVCGETELLQSIAQFAVHRSA